MITLPYIIEKKTRINLSVSGQEKIYLKFRKLELNKMNLQELLKVLLQFFFSLASYAEIHN